MADIIYILNDPTTPELAVPVDLPPKPGILAFQIDGFQGPTQTMYTLEHQAAMCHYRIVTAVNLMNKVLKNPISRWSSTNTLVVQPRAGQQLNAYYDRQALRFFYANNPVRHAVVYAVNSTDVVLHELGHALLDALRPDLFNVQAYEIWGFHEAFGDIHAMINFLHNDFAVDYLLKQTGGNLAQSNILTKLAEEMGQAIYDMTGGRGGYSPGSLRDCWNDFTYVEPEKLPRNGNDNQITSEPHSYSRVFSGTWYKIFVAMYEMERATVADPKIALQNARDALTSYTFNAIPFAPATIRFYDGFAKAMLAQDKLNNYKYNDVMNGVFVSRGILRQPVKPMVNLNWMMFKAMVEPSHEVVENPNVSIVRTQGTEVLTLPDHMVNVEVPNDSYYEFDESGNCSEIITAAPTDLVEHARHCVEFLKEKDMIRPDRSTPFEIDHDGNLKRTHFSGCFTANCTNPNQIEFNKCWKPENNAGCGCGGKIKKKVCNSPAQNYIVITANTRASVVGNQEIKPLA